MRLHIFCLVLASMVFAGCGSLTGFSPGAGGYDSVRDDETTQATFSSGDGSSVQQAVIIDNATEKTGVRAEYIWLHKHYPGYRLRGQQLLNKDGRVYDVTKIVATDGKAHTIYFDITPYFGKD
jgi:hypothetical protein